MTVQASFPSSMKTANNVLAHSLVLQNKYDRKAPKVPVVCATTVGDEQSGQVVNLKATVDPKKAA